MLHSRLARTAFALAALTACQPAARPLMETDATKIRAMSDTYVKTTLAADWDGWGALMADDLIMLPPNSSPVVGKAASLAYVKAYPKIIQFTAPVDEVSGSGNMAYARGKYILGAVLPSGQSMSESGSYMVVFRQGADGSWLETRIIWHSDMPLPTAAAPAAPRRGR